jgi:endonuclease/exonuclease/phosphatase (EEP) superfamily protein YafD
VASRYPLLDCATEESAAGYSGPAYVRCIVEAPSGAFDLVTTHFLSPREGLNAIRYDPLRAISGWRYNVEVRMGQADALAHELRRESPRPLVVAGDLNSPERSLVVRRLLETGLRDAFSSAGTGYGYTYGHFTLGLGISFLRIDHILVSPGIGVSDCFVGGKEVSPHRPVIVDLFVKRSDRS